MNKSFNSRKEQNKSKESIKQAKQKCKELQQKRRERRSTLHCLEHFKVDQILVTEKEDRSK